MAEDPNPLRPDQIVTAIVNGLATWARQQKARVSIARDPFEVLELLGADSPAALRLVVHWVGDEPLGDQMEQNPLVTTALDVVIGLNLGLTAAPDQSLLAPSGGRPALYQLISDLRLQVLAIEFPNLSTQVFLAYGGCRPMAAPDGVPLAAYALRFMLEGSIQTPAEHRPANFRKPALAL